MSQTILQIKFSDRKIPDLEVLIESREQLILLNNAKLRSLVREKDPKIHRLTHNRRLRFIYNGRPVVDTSTFQAALANFSKLMDEISDEEKEEEEEDDDDEEDNEEAQTEESDLSSDRGSHAKSKGKESLPVEKTVTHRLYIHCIVGDVLSEKELQEEDQMDTIRQPSTTPAPIGIDRLLSAGFSPEEVAEVRQQFRSIYGPMLSENNNDDLEEEFETDDEDEVEDDVLSEGQSLIDDAGPSSRHGSNADEIRELEERWIQGTANEPTQLVVRNSGGLFGLGLAEQGDTENRDTLVGMLIGLILGVPSLLLIKSEFKVLGNRVQFPMFVGLMVNLLLATIRQWVL